jgi:hypothetical protein
MRCKACNKILEDLELTRKDSRGDFYDLCGVTRKDSRGDFYDLCGVCLSSVYACELEDDNFFEEIGGTLLTPSTDYDTLYLSST